MRKMVKLIVKNVHLLSIVYFKTFMPTMTMEMTMQKTTLSSSLEEVLNWTFMCLSKWTFRISIIFVHILFMLFDRSFYGGLIGFKGNTKRRIETDTDSEIYIPRHNENSNIVSIKSKNRSNVCSALRKIRAVLKSLRNRMKPTHFLAVPLNYGVVQQSFVELKVRPPVSIFNFSR